MTATKSFGDKLMTLNTETLTKWATDPQGPVALHLKQRLLPVEAVGIGKDDMPGIIYPPTYADIGYSIDTLSDGTSIATIDSVGSQANRMEPIFKSASDNSEDWLVPQIKIVLRTDNCGECDNCKKANDDKKPKKGMECRNPHKETLSILDLAHRGADAVVHSTPGLMTEISKAFHTLRQSGNAAPLCVLAPTSLVFGVWDSRGGTGEKRPRLVRSIIRARNIEPLHAAAQFNSVWKALNDEQKDALDKEAKAKKTKLSEKGFADAPAIFRKTDKIPKYRNGAPNPEARVLGGVLVKDKIERDITINLVALRGLRGKDPDETKKLQKYLLGLSLIAATKEIDLFLREGCHLRYADSDTWYTIPRRGEPTIVDLNTDKSKKAIMTLATDGATYFKRQWPIGLEYEHNFSLQEAKKLLAKKVEDDVKEA